MTTSVTARSAYVGLDYVHLFNEWLRGLLRDAWRITLRDPAMALFVIQTIRRQQAAIRLRGEWEARGTHVPPFMILSVTNRCNLHCKGCYAHAHHRAEGVEMNDARLRHIVAEARDLGVSIVVLAGGEPLARRNLLQLTAEFPEIIFLMFMNGLLLTEDKFDELRRQRNVVPVLSIEGDEETTDARRGRGVHARLTHVMDTLKARRVFFGTSITVTRFNFGQVTDAAFVQDLLRRGSQAFFFLDYVPVEEGTEDLVLTEAQGKSLVHLVRTYRREFPALFIAFPAGEQEFGGCLAAGRGFVHISPSGDLEPCPVSPFSDTNLKDASLQEALHSRLLQTIRENGEYLEEHHGGCALYERRDWLASLLRGE